MFDPADKLDVILDALAFARAALAPTHDSWRPWEDYAHSFSEGSSKLDYLAALDAARADIERMVDTGSPL